MRVFALSDIHVDYETNAEWVRQLSWYDYRQDLLILAGDVTHRLSLLAWCLRVLAQRFAHVLFVPGNHDLWVLGEAREKTSLQKFADVAAVVADCGASMQPLLIDDVLIAPLFGWYDYSFGEPSEELQDLWMDYHACRWPVGFSSREATLHFARQNLPLAPATAAKVITFSHFVPRLDLITGCWPYQSRPLLAPVLGSTLLEQQLRNLKSATHVYGHSHVNREVRLDGVRYINSAFGYPYETGIAAKRMLPIDEI
jgi:predicted phosphodiesterase